LMEPRSELKGSISCSFSAWKLKLQLSPTSGDFLTSFETYLVRGDGVPFLSSPIQIFHDERRR
jgi:hypothetical protein